MYNILVAGGDMRYVYLAERLQNKNIGVSVLGFDDNMNFSETIENIGKKRNTGLFDLIVLPLPVSCDNEFLHSPLYGGKIKLSSVFEMAKKDAVIVGGRVSQAICEKYNVNIIDYTKRDDFANLNSVPTAEGAIFEAMELSDKAIDRSRFMVTGFGRCSEALALRLKALGGKVDVFARSRKDLSHAKALGFSSYHLSKLFSTADKYDIVYNSVPFGIFDDDTVANLKPQTIFIDIASAPGGIQEGASKKNIIYKFLPGLPGKYSPDTAAEIIKEVITSILEESGKDAYEWLLKT